MLDTANTLGRITEDSMRNRVQNAMINLRDNYFEALKENELQEAFNQVWRDWDNKQVAMIYAQVVSAYDLLNLTGLLANRREITTLKQRINVLEKRARALFNENKINYGYPGQPII